MNYRDALFPALILATSLLVSPRTIEAANNDPIIAHVHEWEDPLATPTLDWIYRSTVSNLRKTLDAMHDVELPEVPLACLGNPDPVDMKVYCPEGKETFNDEETTEEADPLQPLRIAGQTSN